MEDTLAFLEKEIQAFEKILAELNGKIFHKQLSIQRNTNFSADRWNQRLVCFLIIVTLLWML